LWHSVHAVGTSTRGAWGEWQLVQIWWRGGPARILVAFASWHFPQTVPLIGAPWTSWQLVQR
jgi:hypothetical protein